MSEPFIGEIRMFGGNFAPRSWALCDGQLLAISQNDALFSLLGTIYGGDGTTTFGLPDLRGRIPIHQGSGPGLTSRQIGTKGGSETVAITTSHAPSHGHIIQASTTAGNRSVPGGNFLGASPTVRVFRPVGPNVDLNAASITNIGGGQSHANTMPFQCVNFIIALTGIFPSRN